MWDKFSLLSSNFEGLESIGSLDSFGLIFEQVGSLHGVMSDKEYDVILNCTYMNLNEAPNLPPSFRGSKSDSSDTMRLLVDKVNLNSQMLLSHSITIMAVEVDYALLELCTGITEESPLAHVVVSIFVCLSSVLICFWQMLQFK